MADRFRTRLRAEVTRWVRDGLVTSEQGERIVARYPASTAWFTRPIALFSLIGGAFIAAAVALVIAHNWQELHRWVKLGGVVALMIGAYAGGLVARDRGYPKLGDGVLLIGGGLLMIGIGLVSQIYNLSGRPADALLLWWVLLLPAAYALPSLALVMLGYTGAFAWYWTLTFDRTSWLGSEHAPNWILVPVALAAAGLLLFPLGLVHGDGRYRSVRRFLEQLGLATLVGSLYPLVFLGIHALARYLDLFGTMLQTSLLFFVTGALVLLLGWALEWLRRRMTAQAAVRRESA